MSLFQDKAEVDRRYTLYPTTGDELACHCNAAECVASTPLPDKGRLIGVV